MPTGSSLLRPNDADALRAELRHVPPSPQAASIVQMWSHQIDSFGLLDDVLHGLALPFDVDRLVS